MHPPRDSRDLVLYFGRLSGQRGKGKGRKGWETRKRKAKPCSPGPGRFSVTGQRIPGCIAGGRQAEKATANEARRRQARIPTPGAPLGQGGLAHEPHRNRARRGLAAAQRPPTRTRKGRRPRRPPGGRGGAAGAARPRHPQEHGTAAEGACPAAKNST